MRRTAATPPPRADPLQPARGDRFRGFPGRHSNRALVRAMRAHLLSLLAYDPGGTTPRSMSVVPLTGNRCGDSMRLARVPAQAAPARPATSSQTAETLARRIGDRAVDNKAPWPGSPGNLVAIALAMDHTCRRGALSKLSHQGRLCVTVTAGLADSGDLIRMSIPAGNSAR